MAQIHSSFAHDKQSLDDDTLPGPWIISNVAGKKFNPGERVLLEIRSPSSVDHLDEIKILQRGATYTTTLLSNVKLCPGLNKIWINLPADGDFAKPNPQNYLAIFIGGTRMDYTATFRIGDPDFGITFMEPRAGQVFHRGDTFCSKWRGNFGEGFTFAWLLFEASSDFTIQGQFFYPQDVSFDKGEFTFQLPETLKSGALYKFGCRANGPDDTIEIFSAGTFVIV